MAIKKTNQEYLEHCKAVHGGKYDYSLFNYLGAKNKGIVICNNHGQFEVRADNHLKGAICPKCRSNSIKPLSVFLKEANKVHDNIYDYSKFIYLGNKRKGIINCKVHGDYEQTPDSHLRGNGCKECGKIKSILTRTKRVEKFIQEAKGIHSKYYNYNKVVYKNWKEKIEIVCPKHGPFFQSPHNHLKGHGCQKCIGAVSKPEIEITKYLENNLGVKVVKNDRHEIKPKELDIYIPSIKLAIEFNGTYWHSEKFKHKDHRQHKTNMCNNVGIQLIHIEEEEWKKDKNRVLKLMHSIIEKQIINKNE